MGDDFRELVLVGLKVRYGTVEGRMVIAVASLQHAIEGRARVLIDMVVANNGAVFHLCLIRCGNCPAVRSVNL